MKHWVLGAMIVGLLLSMLTSWIVVVFASAAAFSDQRDGRLGRLLLLEAPALAAHHALEHIASAPLDQLVFIWLASQIPGQEGIFAWGTIMTGIASKLFGAWVVSHIIAAARAPRRPSKRHESRVNQDLPLAWGNPLAHRCIVKSRSC
jgi:hypothetical protein